MNPLRTLLSIFPQPLHAFMSQGRFYVYISAGPDLEIRQPFHDSIFGTRQIRQPLQGRRISRVPETTMCLLNPSKICIRPNQQNPEIISC